jgi:hypothetical protein
MLADDSVLFREGLASLLAASGFTSQPAQEPRTSS